MSIPIDGVASLLREVAASFVLPRFRALGQADIQEKGPGDLVTRADIDAEAALTARLAAFAPGAIVIGEESCSKDPEQLNQLTDAVDAWIIDPVDGTVNFASGSQLFAMLLAFVRHGQTVAAWIYDPVADVMVTAEHGAGAWNADRRLAVAAPRRPRPGRGLIGSTVSLRCAGQHYLALLSGQAHFSSYYRLKPWDHAAGVLAHREAGGFSGYFDGQPYEPTSGRSGLLLAPDRESWLAARDILLPRPGAEPALGQ